MEVTLVTRIVGFLLRSMMTQRLNRGAWVLKALVLDGRCRRSSSCISIVRTHGNLLRMDCCRSSALLCGRSVDKENVMFSEIIL